MRNPIKAWVPSARGLLLAVVGLLLLVGCPEANHVSSGRSPKAEKWLQRADREYRLAEIEAAHDSVRHAMELAADDEQVLLLAARIALARLEFSEAVRLLRNVQTSEAAALRGRAHWYAGDLVAAADDLDKLLADPDVVDPWAKSITKLARRGTGRKPFSISGGLLAAVVLPRVAPGVPYFIVPLEIDGDRALALISTGNAEVVLDSATRREPSWVSLRFGKRLEVRDVPALTQDLSGISNRLGAPIKALLGANLLRHLNVTLDLRGRQFVARSFVPPPPPLASRVDLYYLRGGGMVMASKLGRDKPVRSLLFIDTAMGYSVALDQGGWSKVGIDATKLPPEVDDPTGKMRGGQIPLIRFGVFELPHVPAVYGAPLERVEQELSIDVDGVVGAGLLANFRLTFSDGGRILWVEQNAPIVPSTSPGGAPTLQPPRLKPPGMTMPLPHMIPGAAPMPGKTN